VGLMIENQMSSHNPPRLPDEVLVAAASKGEPSAMEELLARYRNQVFGVVHRRAENIEEAEDIVQKAILRTTDSLAEIDKTCLGSVTESGRKKP